MMKKTTCVVLTVLLAFAAGCGEKAPAKTSTFAQKTENQTQTNAAQTDAQKTENQTQANAGQTDAQQTENQTQTNAAQTDSPAAEISEESAGTMAEEQTGAVKYYIPEMNATISVPEEYYVFGKDIDFTDEMCREAGVEPSKMKQYLSMSFDQAFIIPRGDSFTEPSIQIRVKVKDNKYPGTDLSKMSETEFQQTADALVSGFSVDQYSQLEKNGMRFVIFESNGPIEKTYRYATIIDGDMIYIYASVAGSEITTEQRDLLESIATSIERS